MKSVNVCKYCGHAWTKAVNRRRQDSCRSKRLRAQPQDDVGLVSKYQDQLRALPLAAGALGFISVLANRSWSGVAPVVDASSSQSRVDVLVIALASTLALTGFQWLTLKPVQPKQVEPVGKEISYIREGLKADSRAELLWAWDALRGASCCRSLVVLHSGVCVMQQGLAAEDAKPGKAAAGALCKDVMKDGRANYLANLALLPGRMEFAKYLPANLSCAILAPVGKQGVLIVGGDTQRGFSKVDQAWITSIADKLDDTLEVNARSGVGFSKQMA